MAVKWIGAPSICGGRLREPGKMYDDLPDGTPGTAGISEYQQLGIVQEKPAEVKKDKE